MIRNMMCAASLALLCLAPVQASAQDDTPTASELLTAMDRTLQFDTRKSTATMTVTDGDRTRSYKLVTFGRGQEDAAVEYLEPSRDKGTRMLKKEDNLWLYIPRAERVQKISGHLLRQGMMGSDVSYEDLMQAAEFEDLYSAKVAGSEDIEGRPCWKIEATAKDNTVSYPKRIIWVDKKTFIPARQELFALSGLLLKTWTMTDVREVQGRYVAHRMEIRDQLRKGSSTVLALEEVSFGVKLQDEVFSRRWLERK